MNFVVEKRHFSGVSWPFPSKKSHLSYEKGIKTYAFLKIELICELIQKESDLDVKMERSENFVVSFM